MPDAAGVVIRLPARHTGVTLAVGRACGADLGGGGGRGAGNLGTGGRRRAAFAGGSSRDPPRGSSRDPPKHDRLKTLFQRGFTPRRIAEHEDAIRAITTTTATAIRDSTHV